MTPFIAEIIGTTLLIILGGGVVANVELNKTIGNNSGWIVVTKNRNYYMFALTGYNPRIL